MKAGQCNGSQTHALRYRYTRAGTSLCLAFQFMFTIESDSDGNIWDFSIVTAVMEIRKNVQQN